MGIPSYSVARLKPIVLRPERNRLSPRRMRANVPERNYFDHLPAAGGINPHLSPGPISRSMMAAAASMSVTTNNNHIGAMTCSRESVKRRIGRTKPNSNACLRSFTPRSQSLPEDWRDVANGKARLPPTQEGYRDKYGIKEEALNRGFAGATAVQ